MIILENISLLPHNTFGIDAYSRYFTEYESVEELQEILKSDIFLNNEFLHIGSGSNLLFINDFDGIILHSKIKGIEALKETNEYIYFRVGAGETWDDFVQFAVDNGYGSIENLSIIPGEVGASAVQNIGAYGVEVKDVIEQVETIDLKTRQPKVFTNAECQFNYRDSIFKREKKNRYAVTYVIFRLSKKPIFHLEYGNLAEQLKKAETNLKSIRSLIIKVREEKLPDPKKIGNAGSFFMNPIVSKEQYQELKTKYPAIPTYPISIFQVKIPAGWLIEQCGWKGKSYGNAGVYEKQALVLVNKGDATGQDVMMLANKITASVKDKFDIDIYPEVTIVAE